MRIFVDLEATEAGEVIAIGAVTDADVRFFGTLAPRFSVITPRITALTGITKEAAEEFSYAEETIKKFVSWCMNQAGDAGVHLFTFGKNDRGFINRTRDFYACHPAWKDSNILPRLDWIAQNMSNGADPIYKAFNKPLVSLRSAYLTYQNEIGCNDIHDPVQDAAMFKELIEAVEDGWRLPEGAELVKVVKPTLPNRDPNRGKNIPDELNRKVIAYWKKGSKDRSEVFPTLIQAAKALCTQAMWAGATAEQAAYRILNAAVIGESYCNRKFFLVD